MINLKLNGIDVPLIATRFSDGALNIKLGEGRRPIDIAKATIDVRLGKDIQLNDIIMVVAQVADIVRSLNNRVFVELILPYIPYARQDRRMVKGDAFDLKLFARFLNMLNIDRIIAFDVHSDVCGMIDNLVNMHQSQILNTAPISHDLAQGYTLVSPDAGAEKKIHDVAKKMKPRNVVTMSKERNVETGAISAIRLNNPTGVEGSRCLIVDDLCDAGGTFIGAAQELLSHGAASVDLWVTHGLFSKGTEHLTENGISRIYTTDSCYYGDVSAQVSVYKCFGILAMYGRGH